MYQHPALVQVLTADRVAALQQDAETGAPIGPQVRPSRGIQASRRAAGWLLVDLGLRLALPRRPMTQPHGTPSR